MYSIKNKDCDNNSYAIIEKIFRMIGVKYTTYNVIRILNSFPIEGSFEAIQLVFKKYNVDSLPTKLLYSHLMGIKHKAILYTSTVNRSFFSILIEANAEEIIYFTPHLGHQRESATQFMNKWDGITLLLDTSKFFKKEPNIFYNRIMGVLKYQIGLISLFTILLIDGVYFAMFSYLYPLIFLNVNSAGVFFCLTYLLKEENDIPLKLEDFKTGSLLNFMTSSKTKKKILCLLSLTYFIYSLIAVFIYKLYFISIIPALILVVISLNLYSRSLVKPNAKLLGINLILYIDLFYCFFMLKDNHRHFDYHLLFDVLVLCFIFIMLYRFLYKVYIKYVNIKKTGSLISAQFNEAQITDIFQKTLISLKRVSQIELTYPFLKFTKSGAKDVLLLIDFYDNAFGNTFVELLNYLKKEPCYNLILGFIGQEKDALYCQFVNFVIFQYDNDSKEDLLSKMEWWYQQDVKIFDRFIQLFSQRPVDYNEKFKDWNK